MGGLTWKRTLLIANPVSHSGEGIKAVDAVEQLLQEHTSRVSSHDVYLTQAPNDAYTIASQAAAYDTVLVLGGDGVIHETVNGLMTIEEPARPQLGIIPLGTGNDYGRTLGIPPCAPRDAFNAIIHGSTQSLDLGLVNGTYFMETLSFGMDAAIAIDTIERRAKGTKQQGSALFVTSGMRMLSTHHDGWEYQALFDGVEGISGREIIFAVQVGPTYGGGFKVCPKANPTDGLFDICYNAIIPKLPTTLTLFGLARTGMHVGAKTMRLRRAKNLQISFKTEPPAQVDGELITGSEFNVSCVGAALRVIVPNTTSF